MERAGAALAAFASQLTESAPGPILVAVGPGNNGGDGLVAARLLKERGYAIEIVRIGQDPLPERPWQLVIDALFGIGLTRPLEGDFAAAVSRLNALDCPILAVDVPSGLCADTGRVLGVAMRATCTLSFLAAKPGLYTAEGPDHCGDVIIDTLGIPIPAADGQRIARDLFAHCLNPRHKNSHKGSFGSLTIIGGAPRMAGAALLAGRAALHLGAGCVHVGMIAPLTVDPVQPELMLREATAVVAQASAQAAVLAVGPGLGQSTAALNLLRHALESALPLVLDADALNLLAGHPVLRAKLSRRGTGCVMTPHPAEAARLLGCSTEAVQADRRAAALELARQHQSVVVLKGCGSFVATADGRWFINTTGNPGLATAGTGDVLSGFIAALLAQHWPPLEAALAAVHLHGTAADALVTAGNGPVGLTAGELISAARTLLNRWLLHA